MQYSFLFRRSVVSLATLLVILGILFSGCSNIFDGTDENEGQDNSPTNDDDPSADEPTIELSVSANVGGNSASASSISVTAAEYVIDPIVDDSFYKPERQNLSEPQRIAQLTPEHFVLQIDEISLYRTEGDSYQTVNIWDSTNLPPGEVIPQHINLAYADNFIRNAEVDSQLWDGFMISFLPGVGETNSMPQHSFVAVNLSDVPELDTTTKFLDQQGIGGFIEEVTDDFGRTGENLRYFPFDGLQPIDVPFLAQIVMGTDFTEAGIQNPEGETATWESPDGASTGNASIIFSPASAPIDFSEFTNPEIVFSWELENLIEVYQTAGADTPEDAADDEFVLTLAVDNPFPLSLTVQENESAASDTVDGSAPGDVLAPFFGLIGSSLSSDEWNVMHWINPTDASFDRAIIVRKDSEYPDSPTDGEIVYEGHKPAFVDLTPNPPATYRYKIFAVSADNQFSAGVNFTN